MVRGHEILETVRSQACLLLKMGYSQRAVANMLSISRGAVEKCIARSRDKTCEGFKSRKRVGRPRGTTPRTDRAMLMKVKRSPRASSAKIQAQLPVGERVSCRTVRRRLFNMGLKARKPAVKPLLSAKNIRDRKAFCIRYKDWTADDWENVLFSDESTFTQFYSFVPYVRRPVGRRFELQYCVGSVKQSKKVMVWGCFSGKGGRGGLWFARDGETINAAVYQNILAEKLPNFMGIHQVEYFQQDGAPCHTARTTIKWLRDHHIQLIAPWPGSSPDLNPIEHLWQQLKRKVAAHHPNSEKQLRDTIKKVWVEEITHDQCRTLARSMPDRIQAVLSAKGNVTMY